MQVPGVNHDRDSKPITNVMQAAGLITFVNSIAERLRSARERRGLTQDQLAELAGVAQSTIGNIESGLRKSPRELLAIAQAVGVAPEWLKSGKGSQDAPIATNIEPGPLTRGVVPLISWVQAGDWNGVTEPVHAGEAEEWIPCLRPHSERSYALRVRGTSMTAPHGNARTYPEGCIIFVDPQMRSPANGQRIIAKLDGSDEVTFKVFKQEDGRVWLEPLNPMHQPIRDAFKVLGTVIGKWEDE